MEAAGASKPTLAEARSFFIAPGTDEAKLRDAVASGAHAVIADFEDLVPPDQKRQARAVAARVFAQPSAGLRLVRVNAPDTPEFAADRDVVAGLPLDAIVVPKGTPDLIGLLESDGPPVLALIETAQGVRLAYETATHPRVVGLLIAPGDLSRDLNIQLRADGQSLLYTRSKLVVDSAAAGIRAPIDIPSGSDGDALRAEVNYARSLGLWGKLCLKPGQADIINDAFASPSSGTGH